MILSLVLALAAMAHLPASEGDAPPAVDAAPANPPVVLDLARVDRSTATRLGRAIHSAREAEAPRVVTRIGDAGGDPALAADLIGVALAAGDVELVAIVDGTVSGAASALVLAHDRVLLAPDAILGAIGAPKDDPSALSLLRAKARQLAAARDRPLAGLEAMIGSGELASHTAGEALAAGLIDGVVEDLSLIHI